MYYSIIETTSIQKLEEEVQKYIKNGYKPHGGIIVYSNPEHGYPQFAQAMIS